MTTTLFYVRLVMPNRATHAFGFDPEITLLGIYQKGILNIYKIHMPRLFKTVLLVITKC